VAYPHFIKFSDPGCGVRRRALSNWRTLVQADFWPIFLSQNSVYLMSRWGFEFRDLTAELNWPFFSLETNVALTPSSCPELSWAISKRKFEGNTAEKYFPIPRVQKNNPHSSEMFTTFPK
jgi:hypothetical protein